MRMLLCGWVLGVAACGGQQAGDDSQVGREETRSIRATEALGYSGDAIADQVDAALDASEQRGDALDAQLEAQTASE